ncbi:hypothetical protein MKEN_00500200 [Mycena kentingensis (nom. inval.)]|nr:hypothetical protein MKEN_00500200 [Mycena kentingensis (nom. inval.)]
MTLHPTPRPPRRPRPFFASNVLYSGHTLEAYSDSVRQPEESCFGVFACKSKGARTVQVDVESSDAAPIIGPLFAPAPVVAAVAPDAPFDFSSNLRHPTVLMIARTQLERPHPWAPSDLLAVDMSRAKNALILDSGAVEELRRRARAC